VEYYEFQFLMTMSLVYCSILGIDLLCNGDIYMHQYIVENMTKQNPPFIISNMIVQYVFEYIIYYQ